MRLLLDTHALLWVAHEPEKLSTTARTAMADADNDVVVSAVSAMEIAIKNRKGALAYRTSLANRFETEVTSIGFRLLSISASHAERAGGYIWAHQDPWDRLLAAQSQIEELTLVTVDKEFAHFNIATFW